MAHRIGISGGRLLFEGGAYLVSPPGALGPLLLFLVGGGGLVLDTGGGTGLFTNRILQSRVFPPRLLIVAAFRSYLSILPCAARDETESN